MKKYQVIVFAALSGLIFLAGCSHDSFVLNQNSLDDMAIVLPEDHGSILQFAANELNLHFQLIFGKQIPIIYQHPFLDKEDYKQLIYLGEVA